MSLATDVRALCEAVNDVDRLLLEGDDRDFLALAMIRDARASLMYAERELEQKLAARMDDKRHVIEGVGTFERRQKKARTQWDTDDLLRAVLDTRLCDEDGVIIEETPVERLLHVWNLGAPRLTALRDRQIDPDEFCHAEPAGFSIQIIN